MLFLLKVLYVLYVVTSQTITVTIRSMPIITDLQGERAKIKLQIITRVKYFIIKSNTTVSNSSHGPRGRR